MLILFMFILGDGAIICIGDSMPGRPMRPFLTVGVGVREGSSSICSPNRHMNASLPELCIAMLGRTIGDVTNANGVGEPAGGDVGEDGESGVVGVPSAGEVRREVVKERSMFSRESVDPWERALPVLGSSMIPRRPSE
jgi:hypothetical protein